MTNGGETQYALVSSAEELFLLLSDPSFKDEASPVFHKLKKLVGTQGLTELR